MATAYGSIQFKEHHHQHMLDWMKDPDNCDAPDWQLHPYSVYEPKFGWHMAVRKSGDVIQGRALCNDKQFVRTYARAARVGDMSQTDHSLHSWLEGQGYKKSSDWEDHKIAVIENDDDFVAPYLDGGAQRLTVHCGYHRIGFSGEHEANNTNGSTNSCCNCDEDDEEYSGCDHCGDRTREDDMYGIGIDRDERVCSHCYSNHYTEVHGQGRRGSIQYNVANDDSADVEVHDYYIDINNRPDDIVMLEDGRYAEIDDAVGIDDEYYLNDDDNIVSLKVENPENGDMYALRCDAWQCQQPGLTSGNWYHDNTTPRMIDGKRYHPDCDFVAEYDDEEDEDEPDLFSTLPEGVMMVSMDAVADGRFDFARAMFPVKVIQPSEVVMISNI